jgi:4-hydroxy-tetrahydrodipicolinate reductase
MTTASAPSIDVILSGATGWAGSALARGITRQTDMRLAGAVGSKSAGRKLGDVLGDPQIDVTVSASAAQALAAASAGAVFVEYSKPKDATLVKANILAAIVAGAHVVVASSGLSDADYSEIDAAARAAQRGVLACGNFAITAVLLQRFAEMAAAYVPHFEIIDSAKDSKPDAPSGTGRELALRLSRVRRPEIGVPLDQVNGPPGVRGATVNGVQVHAVRLPGYVIGIEAIFGMPDQRLHIRHEAGAGAEPYVEGALLAIRKVGGLVGLTRGLDRVMDL